MEIKRFGNIEGKTMMLLHGNLMCWRQYENLIPLLEKKFCVYAVSFDGFDGTGETTYTTAQAQADKLAGYIEKELDGRLDLLYAESLGCGPAIFLKASPNIQIGRMILSGPEYLDFGVLNRLILKVMPQKQRVKQFVQFLFRAAYKQLIRLANVPTLRGIAALDEQDKRLEKIHLSAVPEMVTPVAARIADDNIAEKLRH